MALSVISLNVIMMVIVALYFSSILPSRAGSSELQRNDRTVFKPYLVSSPHIKLAVDGWIASHHDVTYSNLKY
jgi:hypothetical protein